MRFLPVVFLVYCKLPQSLSSDPIRGGVESTFATSGNKLEEEGFPIASLFPEKNQLVLKSSGEQNAERIVFTLTTEEINKMSNVKKSDFFSKILFNVLEFKSGKNKLDASIYLNPETTLSDFDDFSVFSEEKRPILICLDGSNKAKRSQNKAEIKKKSSIDEPKFMASYSAPGEDPKRTPFSAKYTKPPCAVGSGPSCDDLLKSYKSIKDAHPVIYLKRSVAKSFCGSLLTKSKKLSSILQGEFNEDGSRIEVAQAKKGKVGKVGKKRSGGGNLGTQKKRV